MTYYNEIDTKAASWLGSLARRGMIPDGTIDARDIRSVSGDDVRPFRHAHFFAGIGGWAYALALAGWPADQPIWTGSCPCQPYSHAGKRSGDADDRNLWPELFRLIRECRPDTVVGEQVSAAIGLGWLDGVSADLEGEGYAVGAVVLGAHSVGAPHIRQRLYWLANNQRDRRQGGPNQIAGQGTAAASRGLANGGIASNATVGKLGHAVGERVRGEGCEPARAATSGVQGSDRERQRVWLHDRAAGDLDAWADHESIPCRDGKSRRVEPGVFPLAHGLPGRVVLLRGYGNAVVPQTAALFLKAVMGSLSIGGAA